MTDLNTLERAIASTPELKTDFAKKAFIWLLRKTDGLSHDVTVKVPVSENDRSLADQFVFGISDMRSSGGTLRVMPFLKDQKVAVGSSWDHAGPNVFIFVNTEQRKASMGYGARRDAAPHPEFD